MTTSDSSVCFDEMFGAQFYEPVGPNYRNTYIRGQIFWTCIHYTREDRQLWRPANQQSETSAIDFRIESAGADAFDHTPLYTPKLEAHEEFIVVTGKRRPVILLRPATVDPGGIPRIRGGPKIFRPICLVAPAYSLFDGVTSEAKYAAMFVDRMRQMAYPEFFFLPARGPIKRPSYLRLCDAQAILQPHIEPENLRLSDDVLAVVLGQMRFLLAGDYSGEYQFWREELQNLAK
jgi:hypothetical protein